MSLVADYGLSDSESSSSSNSSDSESEAQDQEGDLSQQEPAAKPTRLPPPTFLNHPQTSVFINPFTEAENAKQAVLEKHVKMVARQDGLKTINGKKICWNYRKGRCRFGHNCKYAHDSDLQMAAEVKAQEGERTEGVCQNQVLKEPTEREVEEMKDVSAGGERKRKKRPGLTQGLVPGKKVMKNYYKL